MKPPYKPKRRTSKGFSAKNPGKSEKPSSDNPDVDVEEKGERIAKRMARAGLCSRRDAERWIEAGRVKLNGKLLTTPACVVTEKDHILVDDKELPITERTRLWLLNKRSGLVTTSKDPEGRRTVFEALPPEMPRVLSIGRLDINTEGLLLLTNDGGLARALELPSTGWLRRYRVRAHGSVTQEALDGLKEGVAVEGVLYGAIEAELEREQGTNVWLTFAMREGKNREVKKVLGSLGLEVNRLIRISYGPFQLGDIPTGQVQEVRGRTLRDQLGVKLIAQSGANFDAPLLANLPKEKTKKAPAKKRHRSERPDPLSKLDTKPNRGGANSEKKWYKANKPNTDKPSRQKGSNNADRRR